MPYHLAQVNVAAAVAPLDQPAMAGFVALLDPLDALARRSPGFVWRPGPAVPDDELAPFGDPMWVVPNWSVWESVEALRAFAYGREHLAALRQRQRWFRPLGEPHLALWWVEAGARPTGAQAHERLALLRRAGPTPLAFTLDRLFPAPGEHAAAG
jgi:Domain of unknown function (DUF3291)